MLSYKETNWGILFVKKKFCDMQHINKIFISSRIWCTLNSSCTSSVAFVCETEIASSSFTKWCSLWKAFSLTFKRNKPAARLHLCDTQQLMLQMNFNNFLRIASFSLQITRHFCIHEPVQPEIQGSCYFFMIY